jgi:hypothetical protein
MTSAKWSFVCIECGPSESPCRHWEPSEGDATRLLRKLFENNARFQQQLDWEKEQNAKLREEVEILKQENARLKLELLKDEPQLEVKEAEKKE